VASNGQRGRLLLGVARRAAVARAAAGIQAVRGVRSPTELGRGVLLLGTVWGGGEAEPVEGAVIVDGRGMIAYLGPASQATVPDDLPALGGPGCWIGPGIVDAHVHLAFGSPDVLSTGLVGLRDLGAPASSSRQWRTGHRTPPPGRPFVAVSGPIVTAPGGYPSRSWGRGGFAVPLGSPGEARQLVQRLAADGADVIKVALEPGTAGWPVPDPATVRAVVQAAHATGLSVVAHALRADMVGRAVDAGVDELAHTPTERLAPEVIERIAAAGVGVVSTLQTFFSDGVGRAAAANAVDLYRAGVQLRYGTDLGNAGTRPGVDPRELDRLAEAGLGRLGALRAATAGSAAAPGMRRRTGHLRRGEPAALVLLPGDPLDEPGVWRAPLAVIADGRLIINAVSSSTNAQLKD
jgi:imidazolonepropionase-like amidohydrolase